MPPMDPSSAMTTDKPTSSNDKISNSPLSSPVDKIPDKVAPDPITVSAHCQTADDDGTIDDDVQFVSCTTLPKEMKCPKESPLPLSNNQHSESLRAKAPSTIDLPLSQMPNRESTDVRQRYRSCDIAQDESKFISERSELPPRTAASVGCTPNAQSPPSSPPSDMYSGPAPDGPLHSQTASSTPWTDFLNADQPEPLSHGWRPVYFGKSPARKGTHPEESEDKRLHPSHIPQVSPKTVHHTVISTPPDTSPGSPPSTTTGNPRVGDATHATAPNDAVGPMWPNYEHKPHHQTAATLGAHQVAPMDMNLIRDKTTWPVVPPFSQISNYSWISPYQGLNGPPPAQTSRVPSNYSHKPANYSHCAAAHSTAAFKSIQRHRRSNSSQDRIDRPFTPVEMPHSSAALYMNPVTGGPLSSQTPRTLPQIQAKAPWEAPKEPIATDPESESSNLLRKPSLYSIPPWPTPSPSPLAPPHRGYAPTNYVASAYPGVTTRDIAAFGGNGSSPVYHNDDTQTKILNFGRQNSIWNSTSTVLGIRPPTGFPAENSSDHPPRKRARHEHSPNLVVDIAETCQDLFPFADVAARHNKPIQRVIDTFSAIIQIPLLRNAEDRRRHGSLGRRRMREYRDAKKAMERAHEAKRKTQLHSRKASTGYGIEGS